MKGIHAAVAVLVAACASSVGLAEEASEETFEALFDVAFVDAQTGWAVGRNSVILHTTDGGRTWELQHRSSGEEERELLAVDFADTRTGVAVGKHGLILRTDDGGASWIPAARLRSPRWQFAQQHLEELEIELARAKQAFEEGCPTPEGEPEPKSAPEPEELPDECRPELLEATVQMLEERRSFIAEDMQEFMPAGRVAEIDFHDVAFVAPDTALCLSNHGLLRSTDGGKTWGATGSPTEMSPRAMHFHDAERGWVAGDGGEVYRTDDGGHTWHALRLDEPWRLGAVFFIDEQHGWVGGESGLVMSTRDGGKTWKKLDTWTDGELNVLYLTSKDVGVAIAWDGDAMWTADGGMIWTGIGIPEGAPGSEMDDEKLPEVLAVTFVDDRVGFAVGTWGLVLGTDDSGQTWQYLRSSYKRAVDEVEQKRSIDHARWGFNVDMGFVHPVGKIYDRYGPGMYLGMDFIGGRGWFKIGGGFNMNIMDDREKIVAPPGEIKENEPTVLKKTGLLFHIPVLAQLSLWEKGSWLLRGLLGVGFVYHGMMLADAHASAVPESSNYDRSRIGVGLTQALIFGWMYGRADASKPGAMVRGGVHLKVGIQESWTWDVDQAQTDLGHKDKRSFGTELWPFVAIGLSLYE